MVVSLEVDTGASMSISQSSLKILVTTGIAKYSGCPRYLWTDSSSICVIYNLRILQSTIKQGVNITIKVLY